MFFGGMVTGREPTEELVEPLSWAMWNAVRECSALDYLLGRTQLSAGPAASSRSGRPTTRSSAPPWPDARSRIGEIDACSDDPWDDFKRSSEFTPYAALYNVTGQPAITLPLFQGDDGLPTSIQLGGRPPARRAAQPRRTARGGAAVGGPAPRAGRRLAALGPPSPSRTPPRPRRSAFGPGRRRLRARAVHDVPH